MAPRPIGRCEHRKSLPLKSRCYVHVQTANLLRLALEDEDVLLLAGVPDTPFGYHTQAAIEKPLKALINEHGKRFRYIHDLNTLKANVEALGETLPVLPIMLGELNDYAVGYRYGDSSPPQPLDREKCREAVRLLRTYATAHIQALGQIPPPP